MINLSIKYKDLIEKLDGLTLDKPDLVIILGSGLGEFAKSLNIKNSIPTYTLPNYPASTISGHEGKIIFCEYSGKNILLFQGRIHFYEGYKLNECVLPVFISKKLGAEKILLTNAAGGINPNFHPGDLMLTTSFNGISIKKEMLEVIGLPSEEIINNLINLPSQEINQVIRQSADKEKIKIVEGVYWYTKGPSYETPAEIQMIKKFGGDAVGMSTVHESLFAGILGLQVASISCITNYAAGISNKKLDHSEVTETANLVKDKFERLVKRVINLI
ncbi:MAG: purine-nucleoside phosphorylase [Ignavibacteriaceae bacterium]